MKILIGTYKNGFCVKHIQGEILLDTGRSFLVKTLGLGQIVSVYRHELKSYKIESPPQTHMRI